MIERATIAFYRGIAHGTLDDMVPLTVLVGPNNSGKSSVLEALFLGASQGNLDAIQSVIRRRGWIGLPSTLEALLPTNQATISLSDEKKQAWEVPLRLSRDQISAPAGNISFGNEGVSGLGYTLTPIPPSFIEVETGAADPDALEQAVSRADIEGRLDSLIELLRPLLPGLTDLRILVPGKRSTLHVADDTGRWPAAVAGDGFKRLLLMAARIAADRSGLILVEEPESHMHVGALQQVARLFWEATSEKGGKQIVATTHSLEFLDTLFGQAPQGDLQRSAVYRLSLRRGQLKAIRVPGEKVKELREEIGEDLRR